MLPIYQYLFEVTESTDTDHAWGHDKYVGVLVEESSITYCMSRTGAWFKLRNTFQKVNAEHTPCH